MYHPRRKNDTVNKSFAVKALVGTFSLELLLLRTRTCPGCVGVQEAEDLPPALQQAPDQGQQPGLVPGARQRCEPHLPVQAWLVREAGDRVLYCG